ncbi:MAG: biotin--[acetyl-CoA-carboxylase] ligase [Candidatus Gastranaerophilales bacterium]|nr:biotin--[acetyl-CoA-carboxylase] ligase [Candidatus Gastranaerophilales bacterium]
MDRIKFIRFEQINSTNVYALENIEALEDKTVVQADFQTQGRGRFNRVWQSSNMFNLYFSVVLKPTESLSSDLPLSNLTQYMSVVLAEVLDSYGVQSQIKWPNDVLVGGKKIAGLLAQTSVHSNKLKGVVLGVGVNLNSTPSEIAQIDQKATSLNIETGQNIDKEAFLQQITDGFFAKYEDFLSTGFAMIKDDYTQKSFFLGSTITIKEPNGSYQAVASAINDDGTLNIKTDQGFKNLTTGDVFLS